MNRFLLLSVLLPGCLAAAFSAEAKSVTADQALQRVTGNAAMKPMGMGAIRTNPVLAHTFTATAAESEPMVYVFNRGAGRGYIVTPADDMFPAVLGYGDTGDFNIDSIPDAMKSFLEDYAREIEYTVSNNSGEVACMAIADPGWAPVEPLLTTQWDQDLPYSLNCPDLVLLDSSGSPTGQTIPTVTGCVATSLAQVMNYHKWPDVGVGSNKYEWKTYSDVESKVLELDFSKIHFDWDNMLPKYTTAADGTKNYNDAQAKAVADLMYACGISVNMTYNMAQAGGSGAVSRQQSVALVNNFKYSRSIRYKYRDYCSSAEFERIIYDNLKEGLPVLYNGRSSAGGHSFVCDGYSGNHYFHFNWGWSGISDGYFYLARLDPTTQGIGGSSGGFNTNQGISYNIRPVRDGVDTGEAEKGAFTCVGDFNYLERKESSSTSGETLTYTYFNVTNPINSYNAGFWNLSAATFTGYLGVVVRDSEGSDVFVPGVTVTNIASNAGYTRIPAYLESFGEGVYTIHPAFYDPAAEDGDLMQIANGHKGYVVMTVDADGERTFRNLDTDDLVATAPQMMVNCFNYSGSVLANAGHDYLITVTNLSPNTDYYGDLTLVLKNSRGVQLTTKPLGKYDIPAGLTIPMSFNLNLDVLKATYKVSFRDSYGRDLPGEFPLTISGKATSITTQLRTMSFSPTDILPQTSTDVVFQVGNYGQTDVAAPKFALLYAPTGETPSKGWTFSYGSLTIPSGKAYNLSLTGCPFNLDEGDYDIIIYWYEPQTDGTEKPVAISGRYQLRVGYPVESVALQEQHKAVAAGDSVQLTADITPTNATFRTLAWTSSNDAVATVDNEGRVAAVAPGQAYISATAHNGATDLCEIEVKEPSAIDSIGADSAEPVKAVYTTSGIKVLDCPTAAQIDALEGGVYILQKEDGAVKIKK